MKFQWGGRFFEGLYNECFIALAAIEFVMEMDVVDVLNATFKWFSKEMYSLFLCSRLRIKFCYS